MLDRKDVGSWLDGPGAGTAQEYPGQRLGLPRSGPGAIARFGRRVAAISIDWVMCLLLSWAFFGVGLTEVGLRGFVPNLVFLAENLLLVSTLGATFGQRLLGLTVVRRDGGPALPVPVLVRSVLLGLVLPALFWNADQRGLHDQAAGTMLVRTGGRSPQV